MWVCTQLYCQIKVAGVVPPVAPVIWTRSLPAKSTKFSLPTLTLCLSSPVPGPPAAPCLALPIPASIHRAEDNNVFAPTLETRLVCLAA